MPIIVMICFARSGGTILNQCLGSLTDVLMISETTPLIYNSSNNNVGIGTIKDQAKNWYQIDLKSTDFVESALELEDICQQSGRQLVIRDWTYASFFPFGKNHSPPPDKLVTLEVLERKCKVVPFCFVRDAIDVWLSLSMRLPIRMKPFFAQYLKYVQAIRERNIQVFRYEDFVRRPEDTIRQICQYTGLEFSRSYKGYTTYGNVTGDTGFDPCSRGRKLGNIRPLLRRRLPKKKIAEINQCEEMIEANELLGYHKSYYDVVQESRVSAIIERCTRLIYRCSMWPFRVLKRIKRLYTK